MTTRAPILDGPDHVAGTVAEGFSAVREELVRVSAADQDWSAQFCAYVGGHRVVDLWVGPESGPDALQGVFSSTKGMAAVCLALLVERGLVDLDRPMAAYWPEFGQGGKADIPVRTVLSHGAGLCGLEPQVGLDELTNHELLTERLAAMVPLWRPGSAHGYHALTIGPLVDELVRRVDGRRVADFLAEEIAGPRGLDVFIATPESEEHRVHDVLPMQPTPEQLEQFGQFNPMQQAVDTLSAAAFNAAAGNPFHPLPANVRAVRAAGVASVGGTAAARGLAGLYAACLQEVDGHAPLLSQQTVARMTQIQAVGVDLVLTMPTRFGVMFQVPDERLQYGSYRSFGHDGAGGSIGAADPWYDLSYGYVPRRMAFPGGADPIGLRLAAVVRECLAESRP